MNYYLPLVTCDGVLFESTNQSTAYLPISEVTVYESNPNYDVVRGLDPLLLLLGHRMGREIKRRK